MCILQVLHIIEIRLHLGLRIIIKEKISVNPTESNRRFSCWCIREGFSEKGTWSSHHGKSWGVVSGSREVGKSQSGWGGLWEAGRRPGGFEPSTHSCRLLCVSGEATPRGSSSDAPQHGSQPSLSSPVLWIPAAGLLACGSSPSLMVCLLWLSGSPSAPRVLIRQPYRCSTLLLSLNIHP